MPFDPRLSTNPDLRKQYAPEIQAAEQEDAAIARENQRQQQEAARAEAAAQREADQIARATAQQQQINANVQAESTFKEQGRPYYKSEDGRIVPEVDDATFAAQKAKDAARAETELRFKKEGRRFTKDVQGDPVPLESDEALAQRRKDEAEQIRRETLTKQMQAITAEAGVRKPPLRDTERQKIEAELQRTRENATYALQPILGARAKATDKAGWWDIANNNPTPEAQRASERLARLTQPDADLDDEDLADLEADPTTKPTAATLRSLREQLAADDEARNGQESTRQTLADLLFRRDAPDKWEAAQRQKLAALDAPGLQKHLESADAALTPRLADFEARAQQAELPLVQIQQEQEAITAENEQVKSRGIPAAELVTLSDGSTWHAPLAKKLLGLQAKAQALEPEVMQARKALEVEQAELQREITLRNEAATLAQQRATTERQTQLARVSFTPGMEATAQTLNALDAQRAQRQQQLTQRYPDGVPPEVQTAMEQDLQQQAEMSQAQGQQRHAAALAAYAGVRQRLSDDPSLNATAGELVVEAQRNLAAALQIPEAEAGKLIDDVESLDWTTTQGKHGEVSEGTDNFRRDTRTHRILSNGGLVINPRLLTQPEAYLAAIDAAPASEEAKAAARAQLPDQRRLFGEQALAAFQAYAPSGFEAWRKKRAVADKAFAQLDAIDQATAYADHLRANEGPVGRLLDQIIRRSATGVMALGSQALGIAAGITGSETLMGGAQAIDQYAGASRAMQDYTGANDALGNRIVGQLAEIVPSTAASLGGGALARGGLMAFARTGLGARLLTSMSAGLRTAKTSADAARAMQGLMQTAGLTGAAAAGGAQTYGAQLGDIYGALRDQGLSHEEALSSAQVPALLSGAVTSVLTLLGGATGAEKLLANPETARKLAGNRFQNIAKSFFTEGVKELPEEILDEVFSTVSAELAKNPQASIPEVLAQFAQSLPELAASVFLLGGAGGAISTARQPNDATPPPPAPAALPEDIAAAEAAIDAYAPEGLDEATTARAQATARALLYIAQGDMDSLPDSDLALVGLGRGKDGQLENIKTDDGQPPRVKVENGQPIITQTTLDKLADQLPEVRGVIQLDEVTRRQQIQEQAQAETASPNPGPTEEKPAPAPAPEATPTPGTPQENQPNDPRAQRVTEFTTHFQDLGMPAADAALVAAHLVEKQGVVGESYIEQAVTKEYPQILRALGITGSLSPAKAKEQPLRAPADLRQRLASQTQANAAPLSPAPKDPSTTAAPAPEAAPVMDSPSARGASGQGPATPAKGGVGSPQGAAVAPPATAAPDYLDALNVARQKAIARVPAAARKRFLAFFGGLDGALTKYEAAFPAVKFTDGAAAGLNYTGAGIMVETDGQGNPAALTVNLADLYFSAAAVIPDDGKPRSGQQARAFADFAERAVLHELRHIAALKVISGKQARELWLALSPALRTRVYASYYAPDIARAMNLAEGRTKPADFRTLSAKELLDIATAKLTTANRAQFGKLDLDELPRADAWHMAHEFLRMLDEDAQFAGETSEAMDADPALGQKIIDFLKAVIGEIKRLIDTDLDAPTRVQVREMQKLVEGARKKILASLPKPDPALKGTRPAANLATTGDTRASVLSGQSPSTAVNNRPPLTPVLGSTGTAFTDANDAIEYRWAVVEVNALNISNGDDGRINPDYPQELQPRDRTSAGSEAQVADIAKNLNLDRLSTSSGVGDGAPIIGEDGVVESGNGRIMGARRAYATGKQPSTAYRAALVQRAAEFGLDPAQVQAMTAPVLVRQRTTPVDRVAFVLAANVSTIAPKREIEQAKIDAKQIVPDLFSSFVPSEEGDIFTPANADFIRGFIGAIIPPAERPSIIDAKGNLTQTGLRRIRNALFVHAYGDSSETLNALSRLTETIDGSGNAVTNALVALAPRFAEQNARIASGALYPLSLTEDLAWAVQKLQDLRNRGEKVTDYLAQDGIPGIDDIATPLQRDILIALEAQKQSPRQLTAILDRYARAIDGLGDPKQATLFGDEPRPTREELWKLAQKTPTTLAKGRTTVGDADYLAAVKAGDMETAQRMVDDAAKAAGYDSPKVYHGTNQKFDTFDPNRRAAGTSDYAEGFIFFSDADSVADEYSQMGSPEYREALADQGKAEANYEKIVSEFLLGRNSSYIQDPSYERDRYHLNGFNKGLDDGSITRAEYDAFDKVSSAVYDARQLVKDRENTPYEPRIQAAYLKLKNPVIGEGNESGGFLAGWDVINTELAKEAEESGADGFIAKNVIDSPFDSGTQSTVYAVRSPDQIKSADPVTYDAAGQIIPLSQRFDPDSPSILFKGKTTVNGADLSNRHPPSTAPTIAPKNALKLWRTLTERQKTTPLTPGQSQALEQAERALGQLFLFDDTTTSSLKPAEDLVLEQSSTTVNNRQPPSPAPDQLSLFMASKSITPAWLIPVESLPIRDTLGRYGLDTSDSFRDPRNALSRLTIPTDPGTGSSPAGRGESTGGEGRGGSERTRLSQGLQALPKLNARAFAEGVKAIPGADHRQGQEHFVYHDRRSGRAVKMTQPGEYGARGALTSYLQQMAEQNTRFEDDITIEGWVQLPGESGPRLITSQPWITGRHATVTEIDTYMRRKGFLRAYEGAWWDGTTVVSDALPKNFITDHSGAVHPIDLIIETPKSQSRIDQLDSQVNAQPQPEPAPEPPSLAMARKSVADTGPDLFSFNTGLGLDALLSPLQKTAKQKAAAQLDLFGKFGDAKPYAPAPRRPLESDRTRNTAGDSSSQGSLFPDTGAAGDTDGPLGTGRDAGSDASLGTRAPDGSPATLSGAASPEPVQGTPSRVPERPSGSQQSAGSSRTDDPRAAVESGAELDLFSTPPVRPATDTLAAERAVPLGIKLRAQAAVTPDSSPWKDFKLADADSIARSVPMLLPAQQQDVLMTERRFFIEQPDETDPRKGILFTNGTGTGKTFTGLGIIQRFKMQGKTRVLVVVPSQPKVADWQMEARKLKLELTPLESTQDVGAAAVVTTYANMRANPALQSQPWDLVIYDESHYLGGNAQGTQTENTDAHFLLTGRTAWDQARKWTQHVLGPRPLGATTDEVIRYENAAEQASKRIQYLQDTAPDTKVVFLSATPFSYHKSLSYADGYLFNSPTSQKQSYNQPRGFDKYLTENFGWGMRTNKLTKPAAEVDTGLMEREWAERMFGGGAMSGRMIDVPFDYSREFILLDSKMGQMLDSGFSSLSWSQREETREQSTYWQPLREAFRAYWYATAGGYTRRMQILESMKIAAAIPRIRQHLALDRQIVLFHSYNNADPVHPFQDLNYLGGDEKVRSLAKEWIAAHPDHAGMDFENLDNPRQLIATEFGSITRFFNGEVSGTQRKAAIKDFNTDSSPIRILMVQMDAGKEGISLHDTTGAHQRVLMNAALPIKPTDAIQTEGRIYRIGVKSNAVQEYLVLHTRMERSAFGAKISERTGTVENMALGKMARTLKESFKTGYLNAHGEAPSLEQGLGGKQQDAAELLGSDLDRAKSYYFSRIKKTARTKAAEGADYFATPEPIGATMVRFLEAQAGMDLLEPSAGHGAIARFFPEFTNNKFIEPSRILSDELRLKVSAGKVDVSDFESLHPVNYFDGIAMNPPFGTGGKLAAEHLAKAAKHLRNGGRLVAIVPEGPAMQKRLDAWLESPEGRVLHLRASYGLPTVTFERAGTSVKTKLLVIDKADLWTLEKNEAGRWYARDAASERVSAFAPTQEIARRWAESETHFLGWSRETQIENRSPRELRAETITELFDQLEDLSPPSRVNPKGPTLAMGSKSVYDGSDEQAAPNQDRLDRRTAHPTQIRGARVAPEQGQALRDDHFARLLTGALRQNSTAARADFDWNPGSSLARQLSEAFGAPILTEAQEAAIRALPVNDDGIESMVYLDRDNGVIYKRLQNHAGTPAAGIWPQVGYTADGKLEWAYNPADNPRALGVRLAVMADIGGTPTEVAAIGQEGHIYLKQPLSALPKLLEGQPSLRAPALDRAAVLDIPATLLRTARRGYITFANGRPWLVLDLHADNFIGDNQGEARINDPVIGVISMDVIQNVPGLGDLVRQAATEAQRLGDRANRLFMARKSVADRREELPIEDARERLEALAADPTDPENWPEDLKTQAEARLEHLDWSATTPADWYPPAQLQQAQRLAQLEGQEAAGTLTDAEEDEKADLDNDLATWGNSEEAKASVLAQFAPEVTRRATEATRQIEATGRWRWNPTEKAFEELTDEATTILYKPTTTVNNGQQPSTTQPSPLAKLGWNHLDRSLSARLAALTRWMDTKTSAGQTVAKWLQAENARPFVALGHVLKREFFPDSVLPREIAARKREMEIKTALGSQRAMDMVRALTSTPKFSDIAYPPEFAKNPAWRRKLYLAMTGETPMTALPQELQDLAKRLRGQLIDMGREAVKQKRMSLETFENLQAGYMPHYYKEDVQKEKSLFQRFRLGLRDILAQRTTAWHIVDLETKDSSGEPRLVSWQGNQWRFRGQEHRDAFFEDFILEQALEQITNRNGNANRNLTLADLRAPAKLPEETRGRLKEILRTLRARYRKEAPLSIEQQEKAGLIMDPVYAIARYTAQMVHDNSTAEFFNFVADNKGWTSDTPTPGFTEIPDNPRFGRLAGKHVTDDVARQLLEMVEAPNIALQIYDSLMGWWKTGKALALDTPIPTPTGWTTMGALQEGDIIFDELGQPCHVIHATPVMHNHSCYRVEFSDGTSIVADAEHLWATHRGGDKKRLKISTTEEIRETLHYGTKQWNTHSIPNTQPLQTQTADLPLTPYVLGAWLGDGTSRHANITIGSSDLDVMTDLLTKEGVRCGIPRKDKRNEVHTIPLQSHSPRRKDTIQSVLRRLRLLGSGLKHIPASYLRAAPDQRLALLQGLMDTDGSVSPRGLIEFSTSIPALRDGVLELCRSLGFKPSWSTKPTTAKDSYRIRFHADVGLPVFRLPRKVARLKPGPASPRSQTRQITAVEPVASVPVRCIQVSSPNKLYLAGVAMVPTHNTVLNPGTHVRNVLGNIFFSQLAGTSLWNPGNVTYYWQAITALRNGGADLQEAYEKGVLGADFVSAELRQTLRQLLPDPATIADDGKPDILLGIGKAIGKALPEWAKNPAHKAYNQIAALYQAEDEVFKLAAYLKARAMFADSTRAAEHVRQWFPYFDSGTSGTLKVIGRTAMPFLGFYRESIRIFGHALKERPLSLAAGLAVPSLITFLSALLLGLEEEELEQVRKDQRGKAGKLLGPTPLEGMPLFSMLLPVRSDQGQLQQFDISAVHPFVDFLGNRVEGGEGEDWWQKTLRSLVAAGPIGSLLYSQTTGKDSFGDRTFVENNMTSGEKIAARVDNVVKTALPPLFPGGTGFTTLTNAGTRQTNKTLETRSPTQAVLRAVVGVDVRNATPNLYRIADDWRKAQGLPTSEGIDYGGTTPVSRARAALFAQLAQDRPNETAIANIKRRLVEMGSPIRTPQDVQRLLFYRDPLMIIRGKENQARFRASLTGLERETLNAALIEYEKIKQRAPALLLR